MAMGYEVHITRKLRSWDDVSDPAAISLAEWQAYAESDPEMQVDELLASTNRTDMPSDWELTGASIWAPYSRNGRAGYYARFSHQADCITVAQPDEEILAKMLAVAHALGARVQGDDGEYFEEDSVHSGGVAPAGSAWAAREFRNFQTFASPEAAQPLLAALERQGIPARTSFDKGELAFDPSFANNQLTSKFIVLLRLPDFEPASQVLAVLDKDALSQANPNHYLFTFTDAELFDLLLKPDEWSSFDVALASQLLRKRGRDISPDTLKLLRQHRLAKLAEPDGDQSIWVRSGYASALLGGIAGFFIGYHLHTYRKQLPDGRRVYAYGPKDRGHGLRIMVLGTVMLVLLVGLRVWQEMAHN